MNTQSILNISDISAVEFYVMGDEAVEKGATVKVTNTSQFNDKTPVDGGLYDIRMGTINYNIPCGTCNKLVDKCPGHFGYRRMNYPIAHHIYSKYINKNMNLICIHCHRYIINPELKYGNGKLVYHDHPMYAQTGVNPDYNDILSYMYDKKTSKQTKAIYCDYCNRVDKFLATNTDLKKFSPFVIQPVYKKTKLTGSENFDKFLTLEEYSEFRAESKKYVPNNKMRNINEYSVLYFPRDFKERFEKMPDSELTKHHISIDTHPKNFVFYNLIIPACMLRHVNRRKNDVFNNFITSALESIINMDKRIEKSVTYHDASQFLVQMKLAAEAATRFSEYISSSSTEEKEITSINSSVKGKNGIIRARALGKLASRVSRCVITCNVGNDIDEVNIPNSFSEIIHFKETVTIYNIRRLQTYVNNKTKYPSCNKINIDSAGGKCIINNGTYSLKPRDIVSRNIINGDTLPITRFPSLFTTSTINMRILTYNEDKRNNSTGMNVISCAAINGDFDGDTVSSFQNITENSRAQFDILGNISRNFTSGIDGSAIYGQAQDTIAGCGYLTKSSTKLNITQVKTILNGVPITTKLENRIYSGRELFSMVMPRITLEAPSPFFKNKFIAEFGDFDEDDKIVKIVDGKLISGIVCDAMIKIGKKNTIYHIIYNYYGGEVALQVIRDHQIIIRNFLRLFGMTLDFDSFILSRESKEMIRIIQSSILYKVDEINRKLMNGEIQPPSGVNIFAYVEKLIIEGIYRSNKDKYIATVLAGVNINTNWLVQMWLLGSKGSFDNIEKMLVSIGQVYLDSKRTQFLLDFRRTNVWSQQFSLSPESRGYVLDSYITGYSLSDLYSLSREARNNIITKGLVTADAGTEGRNVIKNSESLLVDNRLFISRDNGTKILQFTAGDDNIDHKNLFPSKYLLFNKTDKFISDNYDKGLVDKLIAERNEFAIGNIQKERCNLSYSSNNSVLSPLNMPQILNIILGQQSELANSTRNNKSELVNSTRDKTSKSLNASKIISMINGYCDNLYHKRFNEGYIQHVNSKGLEIPELFKHAFNVMRILIRSSFDNSVLDKINSTPNPETTLTTILNNITNQIITNFVEPGLAYGINVSLTLTSPFTQYLIDAHHSSASGGTSRDNIKQFKTIVYLKPIDKMYIRKTYVFLVPEFEENKEYVTRLADYIETQKMSEYLIEIRMMCEDPLAFTTFPDDSSDIKKSAIALGIKTNNLHNFVFRLVVDKTKMLSKHIEIGDLIANIEREFSNGFRCAFRETSTDYIIYMFFNDQFGFELPGRKTKSANVKFMTRIESFARYIKDTFVINDFHDLMNVKVKEIKQSVVDSEGLLTAKTIYYIEADGINIADICLLNVVDKTRTFCNNIQEMYKYYGFMEARSRIIDTLNMLFKDELGLLMTNYTMIADIMMELGYPNGLTVSGLSKREPNDPLLVAAYKNPFDSLSSAATNRTYNKMSSPTAGLIMGQVMKIGTKYNSVIKNPEFYNNVEIDDEDML